MSTRFFVSTIPLFDSQMAVHAYQMVTQDGDKLLGSIDDHRRLGTELLAPEYEYIREIGVEPLAGSNECFVELSKYQLLIGMPANFKIPPTNLVCIIDRNTLYDNAAYAKLGSLKRNGYRLALKGLPTAMSLETAIDFFDYILLGYNDEFFTEDIKTIRPYITKITLVITDIPDMIDFNRLAGVRNVLLSGGFYSQPITQGIGEIAPVKINALNLMGHINNDDFDLIDAANTIERDPALSISLLKFLNALNPDRSRRIESIRQAVAILGQREVKKWATVAISIGIGEDRPSEITRLSLLRAKFAENLAPAFDMSLQSGTLFITGLFSMLDVILQCPMHEALEEVAAGPEIWDALISKRGRLYDVLSLIYAYERADWNGTAISMVRNGIDVEVLTAAFYDSLNWYRQLLDAIDDAKNQDDYDDINEEHDILFEE